MRQRRLLPLALLILGAVASAAEPPSLELDAERRLVLTRLPDVLAEPAVARQLTTGLTTSFVFRVEAAGLPAPGGARVEVRYALWDEVFEVAAADLRGTTERRTAATRDDLQAWWKGLRLTVLGSLPAKAGGRASVLLEVIPFSRAEERDARRWFAEAAAGDSDPRGEGIAGSPDDREESLEQVFGVLFATSIRSRAVATYRWTVELPGGASP